MLYSVAHPFCPNDISLTLKVSRFGMALATIFRWAICNHLVVHPSIRMSGLIHDARFALAKGPYARATFHVQHYTHLHLTTLIN